MGIFDRMGKVISSNVNNLLDKAEDDKKLLELNLEEMDEQLKRGRQEVISAVAAEKLRLDRNGEFLVLAHRFGVLTVQHYPAVAEGPTWPAFRLLADEAIL